MNDPITGKGIPNRLFKYRSFREKTHLRLLINRELFLPSPHFNDPFDCNIPVNLDHLVESRDTFEEYMNRFDLYRTQIPEIKSALFEQWQSPELRNKYMKERQAEFKKEFGIYCLSAKPDNLLLWSHYGDSHSGFCVGFDTEKLMATTTFSTAGAVDYTDDYPQVSILDYDKDLFGIRTQLFTKSSIWSYENEYRIVLRGGANKCFQFNLDAISEFYLGTNVDQADRQMFLTIQNSLYPSVPVFQLHLSKNKFRLDKQIIA